MTTKFNNRITKVESANSIEVMIKSVHSLYKYGHNLNNLDIISNGGIITKPEYISHTKRMCPSSDFLNIDEPTYIHKIPFYNDSTYNTKCLFLYDDSEKTNTMIISKKTFLTNMNETNNNEYLNGQETMYKKIKNHLENNLDNKLLIYDDLAAETTKETQLPMIVLTAKNSNISSIHKINLTLIYTPK
ncbi:MAG: hypothetical protein KAS12_04935 [Candidatus Aenigmarchaeota archaeon]|nr:hypothetical protein [Candidatus Aenigmarchaeota archaeon]